MLKENSLESFLQKSGDMYFLVLKIRSKSKFKEKSSKLVWCEQYVLKPLLLKKYFLNYNAKAVSVTMIAKNEKMNPEISCPFTHFPEI